MAGKKRRILLADTALFTVLFIAVRLVLHLFRLINHLFKSYIVQEDV